MGCKLFVNVSYMPIGAVGNPAIISPMSSPEAAIEATITQFSGQLGPRLEAAYLFGSFAQGFYQPGESNINLLFLVANDVDLYELRPFFLPLWEKYGAVLGRAPLIATVDTFDRYTRLVPMLARHIVENGRFLIGRSNPIQATPSFDPHEAVARLSTEAMNVSGALLPMLLSPENAAERRVKLRRLARRMWQTPLPETETTVQTFARIQQKLNPQIMRLPAGKLYTNRNIPAVTAPFLPGLQTLYKKSENIVMVLANMSAQDILRTDWEQMTDRLTAECEGLILTTAAQISLSLVYDTPIDLKTGVYQYNWGMNHLANLQTSRRQLMRHAATIPAHILLDELPHALLTQADNQLHTLIHDFQNKLLNIQLTHELLQRFGDTDKFTPPLPLPKQDCPPRERISGIMQHFNWWADFYVRQMRLAAAE